MKLATRPTRHRPHVSDEAHRRFLVDLEAAQRRDPLAMGLADGPPRSLRQRWTTFMAGLRTTG